MKQKLLCLLMLVMGASPLALAAQPEDTPETSSATSTTTEVIEEKKVKETTTTETAEPATSKSESTTDESEKKEEKEEEKTAKKPKKKKASNSKRVSRRVKKCGDDTKKLYDSQNAINCGSSPFNACPTGSDVCAPKECAPAPTEPVCAPATESAPVCGPCGN